MAHDEELDENIVELLDEEGNSVRFEHLTTLEYQGSEYVVLAPAEEMEDIDEDEVVILKIETDDEGDAYVSVDDEKLLDTLFNLYMDMDEDEE